MCGDSEASRRVCVCSGVGCVTAAFTFPSPEVTRGGAINILIVPLRCAARAYRKAKGDHSLWDSGTAPFSCSISGRFNR